MSQNEHAQVQSLKGTQLIGNSSASKNQMMLGGYDGQSKNKTTNMTDILSQINKKSKSTKHNKQPI